MSQFSIYFVRHGQTIFNVFNRMQGWSDSPLTDQGKKTAKQVGQALAQVDFAHYYSSDSKRAMDTAQLIKAGAGKADAELTTLPSFREEFYGYYEGDDSSRTWSLVGKEYGVTSLHELLDHISIERTKDLMHELDPFHEAENNQTYWERVNHGFDYLKAHHDSHEKILIVTHGTTIRSIVSHFSPEFDISQGPKNGSVTRLDIDGDQVKVLSYAEELTE